MQIVVVLMVVANECVVEEVALLHLKGWEAVVDDDDGDVEKRESSRQ